MTNHLTIKLSDFEGPLDLLLHLIKKSELDIFDLPIKDITDQYLSFIHQQQDMQLDISSDYLVMAATLLQIKSSELLPQEALEEVTFEEDFLDTKEELMLQLLTYKQFQQASDLFKSREIMNKQSFSRLPMVPSEEIGNDMKLLVQESDISDLQSAFKKLVQRKKRKQPLSKRVITEKYTIAMAITQINHIFAKHQKGDLIKFDDVFDGMSDREPMVTIFLALLEMAKESYLSFHQTDIQSEIFIEIRNQKPNE